MKNLKAKLKSNPGLLGSLAILAAVVGMFFQNCAQGFSVKPLTFNLSIDHPSIHEASTTDEEVIPPVASSKLLIGDQRFLESAFRDAFLSPDSPANETGFLDAVLIQEFRREQHLLGRGCDPLEYGDGTPCEGILNNASISMSPSTSSGREAARLQICRRVISNDTMMARVIKKVSQGDTTPNAPAIEAIVRLFYPNMDQAVVNQSVLSLGELDYGMTKGNEKILDRWKVLMLTVCESSGWEAL
jgi:hypothetical protein